MKFRFVICFVLLAWFGSARAWTDDEQTVINAYQNYYHSDTTAREALDALSAMDERRVAALNDTIRFFYHYTSYWTLQRLEPKDTARFEPHLRRALDAFDKFSTVDLLYVELMNAMGQLYMAKHQPDSAITCLQRALVRGQFALIGDETPYVRLLKGLCYQFLGKLYENVGTGDLAVQCYIEAHKAQAPDYSPENANTIMPLFSLSRYYEERQQYEDAIDVMRALLDFMDANGPKTGYYDMVSERYTDLLTRKQ